MEPYLYTYDSYADRQTDRYIPTRRFQVMNSVYLPAGEVDVNTGFLRPDRVRRCRTQAIKLEKEKLEQEEQKLVDSVSREASKGGVRISLRAAILTLAVMLFFCGVFVLTQEGIIADRQKAINRVERSITDYRESNAKLQGQITEASDKATICYAASQNLNMIPAQSANAIHLVAVDTRPQQTARQNASVSAPSEPLLSASAAE